MHCHLLVPGFDWPQDEAGGPSRPPAFEALETLIARGRRVEAAALNGDDMGTARWLFERFGIEPARDWPAAPFSVLADGGSPGDDAWICADPVHLSIERNRLVLADCTRFRISEDEAGTLADAINAHFADSLAVHPLRPQRWYARLATCPEIETTALAAVRGGAIEAWLAQGPDATRWRALGNELQMLLHDHPVNVAREERGELPINSLWLWGAGRMASPPVRPFQSVAASDPLVRGLAQAAGAQAHQAYADARTWIREKGPAGVSLSVLDALAEPSDYARPDEWIEALEHLERDWFAPLLAALRGGEIGMVTVHLFGRKQALHVELARSDLRRFWRRRKSIAAWAA